MEEKQTAKTALVASFAIVTVLVLISTATFAWFTNNSRVSTNTASGKSGTATLALLIGPNESSLVDSNTESVDIPQVNDMSSENLYPVSTADLETFLYASAFTEGKASRFSADTEEKRFWHGQLFFRMEGTNIPDSTTYKLYLDTSEKAGGKIGQSSEGHLLNGARLGLKFEGQEPIILKFEEESKGNYENNTMINGSVIENGSVLDSSGNPVTDPAIEFSQVSLDSSLDVIQIPEQAIATLKANQTTGVDIFFYLEGCDEDTIGELAKNEAEIHLAFYAIAD